MRAPLLGTLRVALTVAALIGAARAEAQVNTNGGALAIGGYDPVAYFTESRATRGSPELTAEWRGARWAFASDAHRQRFVAAPERFAPQYGGFCAYAASQGRLVRIDPRAFTIVSGRLYLNYSLDVRAQWERDRDRYILEADARWPALARQVQRGAPHSQQSE